MNYEALVFSVMMSISIFGIVALYGGFIVFVANRVKELFTLLLITMAPIFIVSVIAIYLDMT